MNASHCKHLWIGLQVLLPTSRALVTPSSQDFIGQAEMLNHFSPANTMNIDFKSYRGSFDNKLAACSKMMLKGTSAAALLESYSMSSQLARWQNKVFNLKSFVPNVFKNDFRQGRVIAEACHHLFDSWICSNVS